jgi:hypothetical protein
MAGSWRIGRPLLRDLVSWHQPIGFLRSVAYGALAFALTAVIAPHSLVTDGAEIKDDHAVISLELAMVRAYCGRMSFYSHAGQIAELLQRDMSQRHIPLREVIIARAGSVEEYCRQAEWPRVNNEHSLMLLETALLRVRPDLSLAELGQWLHAIRIAGIVVFVILLFNLGASVWLALGTMFAGLVVLGAMPAFVYSVYPFLFVLVLLVVSAHGFALLHLRTTRLAGWLAIAVAIGALSAFTVNMRTSYLPIVAMCFAGSLLARWWARPIEVARKREIVNVIALMLCFAVGYVTFERGLITRYLPEAGKVGVSHSIVHPLVLALGVPETAFSRELDIRWEDAVGPAKARSIDPDTDYLGPRYNRALGRYYRGLWETRTGEMLQVYRTKFAISGSEMFKTLRGSPGRAGLAINVLLAPLDWMVRVVWLAVLYAAMTVICVAVYLRRRSAAAFVIGLLCAAACLLQIESAIVYSLFVQQYHNYASFFAMFISLVGVQVVVNWVYARASRASEPA